MCGRFTLTAPEKIKKRFNVTNEFPLLVPNYNVTPGFTMPVITRNSPNQAVMAKWGFVAAWEFKKAKPFSFINIRSESTKEKPYFKSVFLKNRCLVPCTGFFEWKELKLQKKAEKIPFFISLTDQELFSLAGLYSVYQDAEGKPQYYFAILTTTPNNLMKDIHHRMPVILEKNVEDSYLDPDNKDFDKLYKIISTPFDTKKMKAYPVSRKVNSPQNNSKDLLSQVIL